MTSYFCLYERGTQELLTAWTNWVPSRPDDPEGSKHPGSIKLLTLYVSSCAMMNTGKEQGNPSWFMPWSLTHNLKSLRLLHPYIQPHPELYFEPHSSRAEHRSLPLTYSISVCRVSSLDLRNPLPLHKQVQRISPACLNLKFNYLTVLLLLNIDILTPLWMYPRHLFIGHKESSHSSSLSQATRLVAPFSIFSFSFSRDEC